MPSTHTFLGFECVVAPDTVGNKEEIIWDIQESQMPAFERFCKDSKAVEQSGEEVTTLTPSLGTESTQKGEYVTKIKSVYQQILHNVVCPTPMPMVLGLFPQKK